MHKDIRKTSFIIIIMSLAILTFLTILPTVQESSASNGSEKNIKKIYVFGPGGPYKPMKECSDIYSKKNGIKVEVVSGKPDTWMNKTADLIYGGAPYMLTDFSKEHPNSIDSKSICNLYERQVGIIVRKGNPKKIITLKDLGKKDIKLLDVTLESMGEFQSQDPAIKNNIYTTVESGKEGVEAWKTKPELDAWVTYKSWHVIMNKEYKFIPLLVDKKSVFRSTPIAVTTWTKNKDMAMGFIKFLKSKEAHAVFQKYGWK
jgi:accessory colonization factor AcfC